MKNRLSFAPIDRIETELLVVPAADMQTSHVNGVKAAPALLTSSEKVKVAAAEVLAGGEFKAGANETLLLHAPPGLAARRLLLVGMGKLSKVNVNSIRDAAGTAVRFAKPRGIRELVFALPGIELPAGLCARAAVEGAIAGDFDPDTYRTDRKDRRVTTFALAVPEDEDKAILETSFAEGVIAGESQTFARELVNEPGNKLTPTILGRRAVAMAAEVGLSCEVHSTEEIHELKMGAFWGVSQGSEEPPALIVLRYEPQGVTDGPVLGLVGKGITFDAGGISIKASHGMEKMKDDMAGGAAMLGAMRAIALLKPRVRVIAVICAAENMPGGKAQKPGDVQTAMPITLGKPGKTIEIINTDAEGRLVLADGLTYARRLGATHLIDAATLTGACIQALAAVYGGVMSNDEATYEKFVEALKISGEKVLAAAAGRRVCGNDEV